MDVYLPSHFQNHQLLENSEGTLPKNGAFSWLSDLYTSPIFFALIVQSFEFFHEHVEPVRVLTSHWSTTFQLITYSLSSELG